MISIEYFREYLLEKQREKMTERRKRAPIYEVTSKMPEVTRAGTEGRHRGPNLCLPRGGTDPAWSHLVARTQRGLKNLNHHLLPPKVHISKKPGQKWERDLNPGIQTCETRLLSGSLTCSAVMPALRSFFNQ